MSVRLVQKDPMTNADVIITVDGVPGYFTKMSGLTENISRAMFSDGQSNRKRYASSGSSEIEEITINRPFDPDNTADQTAYGFFQAARCGRPFQVQVRPVRRCNGVEQRGTRALFLYGCRVTKINFLEGMDTGAGDQIVELAISFSLDDYAWV